MAPVAVRGTTAAERICVVHQTSLDAATERIAVRTTKPAATASVASRASVAGRIVVTRLPIAPWTTATRAPMIGVMDGVVAGTHRWRTPAAVTRIPAAEVPIPAAAIRTRAVATRTRAVGIPIRVATTRIPVARSPTPATPNVATHVCVSIATTVCSATAPKCACQAVASPAPTRVPANSAMRLWADATSAVLRLIATTSSFVTEWRAASTVSVPLVAHPVRRCRATRAPIAATPALFHLSVTTSCSATAQKYVTPAFAGRARTRVQICCVTKRLTNASSV